MIIEFYTDDDDKEIRQSLGPFKSIRCSNGIIEAVKPNNEVIAIAYAQADDGADWLEWSFHQKYMDGSINKDYLDTPVWQGFNILL